MDDLIMPQAKEEPKYTTTMRLFCRAGLSKRDADIMYCRGIRRWPQPAIASLYGITKQRVLQIEHAANDKLEAAGYEFETSLVRKVD